MIRDSVITDWMEFCLICGGKAECEHHAIPGTANRAKSDSAKLIMPLCNNCHNLSRDSIHKNPKMASMSRIIGQLAFECEAILNEVMTDDRDAVRNKAREKFIDVFGKSYV